MTHLASVQLFTALPCDDVKAQCGLFQFIEILCRSCRLRVTFYQRSNFLLAGDTVSFNLSIKRVIEFVYGRKKVVLRLREQG